MEVKAEKAPKLRAKSTARIVVVENNDDMRKQLENEFAVYYRVSAFANAKDAYLHIIHNPVNLIISSAAMPELDGFSLCKMLKNNNRTCNIPIILLTEKTDDSLYIRALKEGADDCMHKVLSMRILIAKAKNLVDKHLILQKKYTNNYEIEITPEIRNFKGQDEKTVERFIELVQTQISDTDLSVENISKELGMSRISLYRKIKSITGYTPTAFIRNTRLEQAAYLLLKRISISEAAYAVGFNSHSHFSKLFHAHYGCSPTEYIRCTKV